MAKRFSENLTKRFDNEVRFFKSWIDQPKAMGAVLPTSIFTARKMASLCNPDSVAPVLELGPGTGIITKAILERGIKPERLYSVEYGQEFILQLRKDFPLVNILQGDAFDLDSALSEYKTGLFDTIISGIPMLNFSTDERINLLEDLFDRLKPGRPVIQISYGPKSPIAPNWSTHTVEPFDWMVRNVPPARLWVYRRIIT